MMQKVFIIIFDYILACPKVLFLIGFLQFFLLSVCEAQSGRFFLMGDGKIHIRNEKTGKEANVTLLTSDGAISKTALEKIDEVFNFPTKDMGENISPRLIFMLDYFSDLAAPDKVIILESGYRSPDYNTNIRKKGANAAKTSTHMDGIALDFRIEGVDGKRLWELIKSYDCCGVGHYGGQIVHLDSARPRFWEAATSKVHTGESDYNRRIYLSTDYDHYNAGETIRLSFSSVSDFGFGVKRKVLFTEDTEKDSIIAVAMLRNEGDSDCIMINDRKSSRFLYFALPDKINAGRYRVRVDFCKRPFEQMPLNTYSNRIEISK
jgi:uncharacterized protein YcbK (DUF882 family)